MHSSGGFELFRLGEPTLRDGQRGMLFSLFIRGGEFVDQRPGGIENFQGDSAAGIFQEIIDDGARRRVLRGWFLRWKWSSGEGVIVDTECLRGRIKPKLVRMLGIRNLAQWSDVVQNPEGAAVRTDYQIVIV